MLRQTGFFVFSVNGSLTGIVGTAAFYSRKLNAVCHELLPLWEPSRNGPGLCRSYAYITRAAVVPRSPSAGKPVLANATTKKNAACSAAFSFLGDKD